ncbi:MAG: Gfo/Idh/MocA family oxidoreductase [Clostridia bacterium]|nr:Gfo/Idh/MocA family oxidoreductase [Clostridia bacterium]
METKKPVTAIIVGGGHRSFTYAQLALDDPSALKIVGIADPNPDRRKKAMEMFGFNEEFCFETAQQLAQVPKFADAVINGTMDHQHIETSLPLLEAGYDMLLEKPFAVNIEEMQKLLQTVKKYGNKVMICHVLRYSPFYRSVKEKIRTGVLGDIINIQTSEFVSYHHLSTSYVRGKWGNSDLCKTSMLLAKCCHDIDILMWLMGDNMPATVSSFGSIFQFKPENAPEDAGTRCLVDCPLVDTCDFSAKKIYLEHPRRWAMYVWDALESLDHEPTLEDKANLLKNGSPYGKCIYKSGNNVVDHQSVLFNFSNGATATHNMVGGTARSTRTIHVVGTKGEMYGDFEGGTLHLQTIETESPTGFKYEEVPLDTFSEDTHGGGDIGLIRDFVDYVRDNVQSVACTAIENSVAGHLAVFLADRSMEQNGAPQTFDFSIF